MTISVELRCRALVEGGKPQSCLLAQTDLIDVRWRKLGGYFQLCVIGNDGHQGLGRRDDAADRVNRQLVDYAGDWRANVCAGETILDRDLAFCQLRDLGFDDAELTLGFGSGGFVDGDNLQLDFT